MSFDVLLTFLLMFSFPSPWFPPFYRSAWPAGVILALIWIFDADTRRKFNSLLYTKYVLQMLIGCVIFIIYAHVWTMVCGEYEFELRRVFMVKLLFFVSSILLFAYLNRIYGALGVLKIIFYAFLLQSIISVGSFTSVQFLTWNRFISPISDNPNDLYAYLENRGFALAAVKYFGLSVPYSFLLVFYVYFFGDKFKWKDVILVSILIAGACFTARSFFLGLAAATGVLILLRRGAEVSFKVATGAFALVLVTSLLATDQVRWKWDTQMYPWLFEWLENYKKGEGLTTRSSNVLIHGHYFALRPGTLAFGDGRMLMHGVTFYMPYLDTDAGYIRVLGFGGIPYLIAIFLYHCLMLWPLAVVKRLNSKITFAVAVMMLILFQFKGDIWGSLTFFPVILFLMGLCVDEYNRVEKQRAFGNIPFPHPFPPPPPWLPAWNHPPPPGWVPPPGPGNWIPPESAPPGAFEPAERVTATPPP